MKKIIGLTFPKQDKTLGLEPSILTVLPQGENVFYSKDNICFCDNEIEYYLCSVYISGMDEFKKWAKKHNFNKIVVGGYHPTLCPNEFLQYAHKIVIGSCDDFYSIIQQNGQIINGITNHKYLPRYDLYDFSLNQQIIPNKQERDIVVSINTSQGCPNKCNFCCTPLMNNRIISKPIELIQKEIDYFKKIHPKFIFIRDENFSLQYDYKERLSIINQLDAKIYMFSSANSLNEEKISFLKKNGIYMICLGLENINEQYNKNDKLYTICQLLKKYNIYIYLSFIVNPLEIIYNSEIFYKKLLNEFYNLQPEMVCGNFLMPFPKTQLFNKYSHIITKNDYKNYTSKSAFLIKKQALKTKMEFDMFYYQWKYFTSNFYNTKIRNFYSNDTLHLRFLELYKQFVGGKNV